MLARHCLPQGSCSRKNRSTSRSGFALILALVLLGFLLLLLLSLSALTNVSLRAGGLHTEHQQARANALLALAEAMGSLQQNAGADQRVTARAALLDANSPNPWWTGVWRSDGATTHSGTAPAPQAWLVSGAPVSAAEALLAEESALLVAGTGSQAAVRARLVEVGGTNGEESYAWWVGDEGVKANFTVTDPYPVLIESADGAQVDQLQFSRWRASQGVSLNAVEGLNLSLEREAEVALREQPAQDNLPLLLQEALQPEAWRRHFHDFSAWSRGLLTDTKNGGLRYDLTQAFETDSVFNRDFLADDQRGRFGLLANIINPLTGTLDTAASLPTDMLMASAGTWAYKGPNFGILKDYYRLYDALGASPLTGAPSLSPRLTDTASKEGPWPSPYKSLDGGSVQDAFHTNNPIMVSLAYAQMGFGVSLYYAGTNAQNEAVYKIQLESRPVVAFYNPHNVTLADVRLRFRWAPNPRLVLRVWDSMAGGPDANQTVTFRLHEFFPRANPLNPSEGRSEGYVFLLGDTAGDTSFDFLAGETRYFSLGSRQINYGDGINAAGTSYTPFELEATYAESGRVYMRLDDVRVASVRGESTATNPSLDTTGSFGLTMDEKNALTVTVPAAEDPLVYLSRMNVSLSLELLDPGRIWLLNAQGNSFVETLDMLGNWLHVKPPVQNPPAFNLLDAMASPALVTFGYGLSSVQESEQAVRVLQDANIRPLTYNTEYEVFFGGQGLDSSALMRGGMLADPAPQVSGERNQGRWVSTTGTLLPLFEVPVAPLQSLASFQHAHLSRYNHEPSYAFANSLASVRVPRDAYFKPGYAGRSNWVNYDISFVMNEKLWDGYYFSTLPYDALRKGGATAFDAQVADLIAERSVLPNSRMRLAAEAEAAVLRDFSSASGTLSGYRPAALLEVEGAFNVNSDSQAAWEALLKTFRNGRVPVRNPETGSLSWSAGHSNAFSRSSVAAAQEGDFWKGFRVLSDAQIKALAEAIVAEGRARGPYLSLASFVNRKLSNDAQGLAGTLQAAIGATDINTAADSASGPQPVNMAPTSAHLYDNSSGPQAAGFPGFLSQADILQVIGPVLSARSDTFRIRTYGEVAPSNGQAPARAWCEAIVTRSIEPVENDDTFDPAMDDASFERVVRPPTEFGRRFKVVAFRWLNEDEL